MAPVMIVKMKKITLLCLAADRPPTLEALRDLGALHLVPLARPETDDFTETRHALDRATAALNALSAGARARKGLPRPAHAAAMRADPVAAVHDRLTRKRQLAERLDALRAEQMESEPFGDFDPALVRDMAARGMSVRLYHSPSRKPVTPPENACLVLIREDDSGQYFVVVGIGDARADAREIPLPARRPREIRDEQAALLTELDRITAELAALAERGEEIRQTIAALRARIRFIEAREGMGIAEALAYLQGFCPEDLVATIRKAAMNQGWGLVVDDPDPADRVPTLIRNPAWVRPIQAVFSTINILPGYREADVSVAFLVFLSLFFAMIVGDVGYGLVFLLITALARLKARQAPKGPFQLLTLFSVCTIVWGVLCGVYFGITELPAPLRRFRIDWLGDNLNVMHLCLIISAIHLSLAHAWNLARTVNSLQAIAQAGWIAVTWSIFLLARQLIVGVPRPSWFFLLAAAGLAAVILFMTPPQRLKTEWVNHLMLPLTLMSNFGDVLSYLRLFALSIAGLKLAGAFNVMALSVGFSNPLTGLVAAVILFAGHSLNIALSAVSVLVHGIRLNALEFSMHFGLEWTGFPYEPFAGRGPDNKPAT
ncbi:MAG: hypothetical protein QME60_01665 [Verrucomicrobiota bacterium]|nr:hypothetical protein [Verrucomicrobiota bacterium]